MFDRRAYAKEWRKTHIDWPNRPPHYNRDYARKRKELDPNYRKSYMAQYRKENVEYRSSRARTLNQSYKLKVMSHYGKNGAAQCCWDGCTVNDLDMLTLDHINDNGKEDRARGLVGARLQKYLIRNNFPEGFQTLCANHNLKKMIEMRKRNAK